MRRLNKEFDKYGKEEESGNDKTMERMKGKGERES